MSKEIPTLAQAIINAQKEMGSLVNNAVNPHFRSNYASLDEVIRVAKPCFEKHGIYVEQGPKVIEGTLYECIQLILARTTQNNTEFMLPVVCKDPSNPQQIKSARTYARRQLWEAVSNLAASDDDDGNAASQGEAKPSQPWQPSNAEMKKCQDAIGAHADTFNAYLVNAKVIKEGESWISMSEKALKSFISNPTEKVNNAIAWHESNQEVE